MFKPKYFGQRFFSTYMFEGGIPATGTASSLAQRYFKADYFNTQTSNKEGPFTETLVPSSIAISVSPMSVSRNTPITITVFVYDQFSKPMPGVAVDFASSFSGVLSVPSIGTTNAQGRLVTTANTYTTGNTLLSASTNGYFAATVVTVTGTSGGVQSTLTHGATIQVGSGGGGTSPIGFKYTKKVKSWPTR